MICVDIEIVATPVCTLSSLLALQWRGSAVLYRRPTERRCCSGSTSNCRRPRLLGSWIVISPALPPRLDEISVPLDDLALSVDRNHGQRQPTAGHVFEP